VEYKRIILKKRQNGDSREALSYFTLVAFFYSPSAEIQRPLLLVENILISGNILAQTFSNLYIKLGGEK